MEFGKGWEGVSGDWGKGRRNMNMHLQQYSLGFSVVVAANKRQVQKKNPAKNKIAPVILSQKKTRIGTKKMDKLQFSA